MTNRPSQQRVVVLVSGAGSIMSALIAAADAEALGGSVVAVVSDKPDAPALDRARDAGVATAVVALADFPDRAAWDLALARTLSVFSPNLVVCAGFMKILGPAVLGAFEGRIINTHPALLPAFPGAHAVRDALAAGVSTTGCTVMMVDAGVDTGPVIAQEAVAVLDGDTEQSLHERIKTVERSLVVSTVSAMLLQGFTVEGNRVTLGQSSHHGKASE